MYETHLREALRLAARGRWRAAPNPMVGAIVLDRRGRVVGRGFHAAVGGPHAEIVALAEAGERARDGTLLVTLEPCSHHGRTPPCVETVVASGVARVVACHRDPDVRVGGRGFRRLREAGIEVEVGILAEEAVALNLAYLVATLEARPSVTLKWAMSLDGKIATATGESQWISSPAGRRWALELREEHDAVLVGSGTLLADDPSLDRRLGLASRPNTRVVLDRRLRTPPGARIFAPEGAVLIYTQSADAGRRRALEKAGAKVVRRARGRLPSVLRDLHRRGVRSLLVEGGGEVLGAFVVAGLFDRVAVCCAPRLIGGDAAPGPIRGAGVPRLAATPRLERVRVGRRAPDLVISGLREGRSAELLAAVGESPGRREPPQ